MLRWAVQQGFAMAPQSTDPARLAQNIDVFDFALSAADGVALDALGRADAKMPDADVFGL